MAAGQSPSGDHGDGAYPAAEIEDGAGAGAPRSSIPGGEDVVGGVAVTLAQLEDFEVPAQGVERFCIGGFVSVEVSGDGGAGDGVALEVGLFWRVLLVHVGAGIVVLPPRAGGA